ncbi:GerMN domain-containing protein [Paenibacillus sp. FSL K6-2524]|uniref:GerMN domain-containing protein n=1 Tax=Paenibacillus sp. FSL K6-2524 TaxID=2954516 RepID=UPI0030FC01FA
MKKIGITLILVLMMITAVGCGQKPLASSEGNEQLPDKIVNEQEPQPSAQPDSSQGSSNGGQSEQVVAPVPQMLKIKVYYTDDDIMDLKEMEQEITVEDANPNSKYSEAFKSLQKVSGSGVISLWEKVILNTASFADGEVTVDIQLPDEARLGSGGESLAIDALKATFFQFEEVKKLELTVNGDKLDSLMGHVELEHPMTK